ncbi:type IV secretory system conjugative DNA transfer family protein [Edaphobacter aggregans]|uniref:type IV secretory system conjugative DNA transfer family protein n=1 Tax=Edaphobacter aggregans TaxID=570835 RepID=UPI00054E3C78|nr:TraM recognition domain-containing protein [Edaphobacter aggregans]
MRFRASLQNIVRPLVKYRLLLSLGLSAACGIVLNNMFPINSANPFLRLIELKRPLVFQAVAWSYDLFLYSTPFIACSMIFSLLYVHLYRTELGIAAGALPPYPDPHTRTELSLVLGEVHRQLVPKPSPAPQWLAIPERGLYTGIASFGSIGSGKTYGLILPAMRQLFAYCADDPARRLSGIVLEVKGDLCRQLQRILKWCGREQDYVEVSLNGDIRYNPLNNSLDAYAQSFNVASIITSIWGKGKEPFWQQSYTDLMRYVILLHRIRDGYLTMVDLFRTVISAGKLEEMLTEVGSRFSTASYIGVEKQTYLEHEELLSPLGFEWNKDAGLYLILRTEALEDLLTHETSAAFDVLTRRPYRPELRDRFDSIQYWYWEHWKFFRSEVKTSIIQGIVVFLSLFETDPDVRRVFCPPKELYDGKPCAADPHGRVLPPFEELIESGAVVGLNFPVALNPALAKTIGTMMKIDYQRAVQLRIPKMDAHPDKHFRPTVFICDEYQNFPTVGGDNPTGDDRFYSMSRQPKCIPIVATQSVSSLKEALPNEGVMTLLQALRNKVFLTTTDPETARYASELCGKADRTRISYTFAESSTNANVGWLSGHTTSSKGSVSASKQYQKHKEPLFEEKVFFDLKNAQSVVVAFDGVSPLPPTYCYLKPDFLPITMSWFDQEQIAFDPRRIQQ